MFGKLTTLFGRETRETYSDAILKLRLAQAENGSVASGAAVFEACAGAWERGFAAGSNDRLTAPQLAQIGRDLVERGESVWLVRDNALAGVAASHDVHGGGVNPMAWRYRLDLVGPSDTRTVTVPGSEVLHVRINTTSRKPWRGRSPWALMPYTAALAACLERQLADEAGGPSGYVLPVPKPSTELAADVAALRGAVTLGETQTDAWGGGPGQGRSGANDWRAQRFGADVPAGTVELRSQVEASIAAAAGVPPELVAVRVGVDARREAWRVFAFGTLMPVAQLLAPEVRAKLGGSGNVTFDRLAAADVQGRARPYKSLTDGGMDAARAAEVTGF